MKESARDRLMYQTGRAEEYLKVINQNVETYGESIQNYLKING